MECQHLSWINELCVSTKGAEFFTRFKFTRAARIKQSLSGFELSGGC